MNSFIKSLKSYFSLILALTIFVLVVFILFSFINRVQTKEFLKSDNSLEEIAQNDAEMVEFVFESFNKTLIAISTALEQYDNITSEAALKMLKTVADRDVFDRLAIDTPDGMSYTSDGFVFDVSAFSDAKAIRSGVSGVSDVFNALADGEPVVNIIVPINGKDGMPAASLRCVINTTQLSALLYSSINRQSSYFFVVDSSGSYAAAAPETKESVKDNQNLFESLKAFTYDTGFNNELIMTAFAEHKAAHSRFMYKDEWVHAHFVPIDINGWMMVVIVPISLTEKEARETIGYALNTMLHLVAVVSCMFLYVYRIQTKERKKAVLDERCFRVLAAFSGKAVVEWDYSVTDTRTYHSIDEIIEADISSKKRQNDLIGTDMIHPDDRETHRHIIDIVMQGNHFEALRLRLMDKDGVYRYCLHSGVTIKDEKGRPYKTIGFFENIDEQVRREERLRTRSQTDALTGLYNKSAVEQLANDTISSSNKDMHALICFDLDNFKDINDSFGHMFGDNVLREVAVKLKQLFRSSDILGRFGGDEFVLFILDMPGVEFAMEKAEELRQRLKCDYTVDGVTLTVTASIGVSIFPHDGQSYETLYQSADSASYKAKKSGKNNVCFCSDMKFTHLL